MRPLLSPPNPSPTPPYISAGGKVGSERNIGETQLFIPLAQSWDELLFADLRLKFDTFNAREGNFGLGYRKLHPGGYIWGAYGFYDYRHTAYNNDFSQLTVGTELLTRDYDARINLYLPEGTRKLATSTVSLHQTGTQLVFNRQQAYEKGAQGADMEIGRRIPIPSPWFEDVRLYGGVYKFLQDGEDMNGVRARIRWQTAPISLRDQAINLRLSAETQFDNIRGDVQFYGGEVVIPFRPKNHPEVKPISQLHARMLEPIVRDVDIVTDLVKATPTTEAAKTMVEGVTLAEVHIISASSGADFNTQLAALPSNSAIILDGSNPLTLTTSLTPKQGQAIIAPEAPVVVSGYGTTTQLTSGSRAQLIKSSSIPSATALIVLDADSNVKLVNIDLLTESGDTGDANVMISNNGNAIQSLTLNNVRSDGSVIVDMNAGNATVNIDGGTYHGLTVRTRGTANVTASLANSTLKRSFTRSEVYNANLTGMAIFESMDASVLNIAGITDNTFVDDRVKVGGRYANGIAFITNSSADMHVDKYMNNAISRAVSTWDTGAILGQAGGGHLVYFHNITGNSADPFEAVNVRITVPNGQPATEAGFEALNPGMDIINYGNTLYSNP